MADRLLVRLEALAPSFKRAAPDMLAIVSRARAGDHRGVLQNARLVAETLMRDLYSREIGQAPGKKMLGDLTAQFRQSAHAGVIPNEILFFIDGIAAAGNLGAHDHAATLDDDGVQMSEAHAFTALNNLVAILTWYAQKYFPDSAERADQPKAAGDDASIAKVAAPPDASTVAAPQVVAQTSRKPTAAGVMKGRPGIVLVGVVLLSAAGAFAALRGRKGAEAVVATSTRPQELDRWYEQTRDPSPPEPCRASADLWAKLVPALADSPSGIAAVKDLSTSPLASQPEVAYVLATRLAASSERPRALAERAAACDGFAAAQNLAGKLAFQDEKFEEALALLGKSIEASPTYVKPRFNRGLIRLKLGRVAEAVPDFEFAAKSEPAKADIQFGFGHALLAAGRNADATAAFCRARELGLEEAGALCPKHD